MLLLPNKKCYYQGAATRINKRKRREIAKMEEALEFREDLKERMVRWQEMEDGLAVD